MSGLSLEDLPGTPDQPARTRRAAREAARAGGSAGGHGGQQVLRSERDRRKRRRTTALAALAVGAVLFGGGAVLAGGQVSSLVGSAFESGDYEGEGTGSVEVTVPAGASGRTIASVLSEAGVVKTSGAFLDAAAENPDSTSIQPGVYELRQQMSGASAIALLLDPASRKSLSVTVIEGWTATQIYDALSGATGDPVEEYTAAAADPALGLPAAAGGSAEGYLFPATYDFDPGTTPLQQLQAMVTRTGQAMDAVGFPADPAERHRLLTEASLVQKEGANAEDMAKVARVIENRIAAGQALQFDTTVNYATGKTGLTTTSEDRQNPSPYNTYLHQGLPPGPIASPGEEAMGAALQPAEGDWLYFVVTDPSTGQTAFARTYEEHQQNVAQFQAWLRANPQQG